MSIIRPGSKRSDPTTTAWREYGQILSGAAAVDGAPSVAFAVSTADPTQGKGDLYVALGLARALRRKGWAVSIWPSDDWRAEAPVVDVLVVMLESFVPGTVHPDTLLVAWVRNWTERWVELPFLDAYDLVFASSSTSAAEIRRHYDGEVRLLPIAVDADLFSAPVTSARPTEITTTINFWGVTREIQTLLPELAQAHSIAWYGAHGERANIPAGVDYRGLVGFDQLPRVYRSSQIVLDDLIAPAKAFDNQNSRLFEALAAGAVPVTNARPAALEELGLGDVPSYSTGPELMAEVERLLTDPAARAKRAEHLQQVVLARHSYDARSADFIAAWRDRSPRPRTLRPSWLAWANETRQSLRETADLLDRTQRAIEAEQRAEADVRAANAQLHERLAAAENHLAAITGHPVYRLLRRLRRLMPSRRH